MSGELRLLNRQRTRSINLRQLRWLVRHLLGELLGLEEFDLTIYLVGAAKMAQLNETHMNHTGSTDVITLDYSIASPQPMLAGELFICVDEALLQARRFHTTWQSELARYIVHGVLHLQGYDDLEPVARRRMKRQEGRRLRELSRQFDLSKLELKSRVAP